MKCENGEPKYIATGIPDRNECGFCWWVPKDVVEVIEYLEKEYPEMDFVQFVTRPGNGGHPDYALLRRKK